MYSISNSGGHNKIYSPKQSGWWGRWRTSKKTKCSCQQDSYLFLETTFQDFSRTQIVFCKGSKIHINHYTPNISMLILLTAFHTFCIFLAELIPELSRTSGLFPGLSSPGKCHNKIPGLSRFFRTRTNPVSRVLPLIKMIYPYLLNLSVFKN